MSMNIHGFNYKILLTNTNEVKKNSILYIIISDCGVVCFSFRVPGG